MASRSVNKVVLLGVSGDELLACLNVYLVVRISKLRCGARQKFVKFVNRHALHHPAERLASAQLEANDLPPQSIYGLTFGLTTNALPWLVMFPRDGVRMEHTVHREHDCSSAV
jgi:hypothetical protein